MLGGLSALGQLSLFLASLFMLWMILKVLLEFVKRRNGKNGHLTEDKVRLIVSQELQATRHELRNSMQALAAQILEELRDWRR